jgi:lauroyl/myristoyl acyltransferase
MLALSPIGMRARRDIRATFPDQRVERIAADWLGRPFRDHVNATRIAAGVELTREWTVEMRGPPAFLDDPRQSFIIATGHFSREAMSCLYMPWILQRRLATVIAPLTEAKTPRGFRVRLQMREMVKGIRAIREDDVDVAEVAGKSFLVRLLHHLREPGGAVVIASDASWGAEKGGGLTRAFAGYASQTFAFGTARLARLSQCPIVTCVPFIVGDRHIVMEWSPVIPAPARDDAAADIQTTNTILDWIERRIGERPDQYVLSFGTERRWSPTTRSWTDGRRAEPSVSNDLGPAPMAEPARTSKSAS